jgi:uncharacterized protein YbjQ (UPF0145 family)
MIGGEVTAFTTELEKATALGVNAIVGLDIETFDIGLQAGVTVISAPGTAVVVRPE